LEVPIKKEFTLNVKLNRNVCPECSKHASGYYEAVLQLRGDKRPLDPDEIMRADEIIKKLLEKLFPKNRMAYLTQRIEIKEGIDYYFGSYKAARKVSNALKDQMGGVIGESPDSWAETNPPVKTFIEYGYHIGFLFSIRVILSSIKNMQAR
jgi:nonsense-mediated mRNA decay protein 3